MEFAIDINIPIYIYVNLKIHALFDSLASENPHIKDCMSEVIWKLHSSKVCASVFWKNIDARVGNEPCANYKSSIGRSPIWDPHSVAT